MTEETTVVDFPVAKTRMSRWTKTFIAVSVAATVVAIAAKIRQNPLDIIDAAEVVTN